MKIYKLKCFLLLTASILSSIAFLCVTYIKVVYPVAYSKEIASACEEFGVEESLVRSVINVESGYNELAVSKVGARGLMQIMPETGEFIARELGISEFSVRLLFSPELNIRMGVYYLRYLMDKYNELELVLFAYNAGEGRLNEYLKQQGGMILENIEIVETRNYIRKVKKNITVYERLNNISKTALL